MKSEPGTFKCPSSLISGSWAELDESGRASAGGIGNMRRGIRDWKGAGRVRGRGTRSEGRLVG